MKRTMIKCTKCETVLFHEWFENSKENICEFCKPKKEIKDEN